MNDDPITDPIAEQLHAFRERYTNRRTVPWALLSDAEKLVAAAAAYHRDRYNTTLAALRNEHDRETSKYRSQIEAQQETIATQERLLKEKRTLNEARRAAENEHVEVTIRSDGYEDWCVADLEEIAFRLRCGGATDETHVSMASNRAIALVPVPDLVRLDRPRPPEPPDRPDPLPYPGAVNRGPRRTALWRLALLIGVPFVASVLLALVWVVIL